MTFWLVVIILGIVEGLTEFIPVSSTGHLIVADQLLHFREMLGPNGTEKAELFEIFIQLGAVLAIGLIYREKLFGAATRSFTHNGPDRKLAIMLVLAFLPVGVIGLLTNKYIKAHLFSSKTVAGALIVGGLLILLIERLPLRPRTESTEAMSFGQAFGVGCAQVFSLFPGTSRSAATIMGGLLAGVRRPAATEFSFLLSFPTMMLATLYSLWKSRHTLDSSMTLTLAVGFAVSFIVAMAVVKWLIRYVQTHDFTMFAAYRILFGGLILYLIASGHMNAAS
jgi:undecaprenyl-diphosphatase